MKQKKKKKKNTHTHARYIFLFRSPKYQQFLFNAFGSIDSTDHRSWWDCDREIRGQKTDRQTDRRKTRTTDALDMAVAVAVVVMVVVVAGASSQTQG